MSEESEEVDIFKVLSHPVRRKLIKYIGSRGTASYKDLTTIVPKPGALYHHLRLLGDLIYQDKHRLYRLTSKGQRVYEFLTTEFFVPEDKSIHRILTPRFVFERIEGGVAIILIVFYCISNITWFYNRELLPLFIVIAPAYHDGYLGILCAAANWFLSSLFIWLLIRVLNRRRVHYFDVLSKIAPPLLLINLYPLFISGQENLLLIVVIYVVVQFFALLLSISAVSVIARVPLRSALVVVILLHYFTLIATIAIILFGPVKIYLA